jgi:hypothetical protein
LVPASTLRSLQWRYETPTIKALPSWLAFLLSHVSLSRGISLAMRSWERLCWGILFVLGILYATSTLYAEKQYTYGQAISGKPLTEIIQNLRNAGRFNPFDPQDRAASARMLAILAIQNQTPEMLEWARAELVFAIQRDPTSADLLLKLMAIDLTLKRDQEAQFIYDQFKRVNAKSPIIQLVDQAHQKQAAPSPANPDGTRSNQHD